MSAGSHQASIAGLEYTTDRGFRIAPELFGPAALANVTALYVEGRTDLPQFEEDVEAILRVWGVDDPLEDM